MTKKNIPSKTSGIQGYAQFASDIHQLLEAARTQAARSVNAILTAAYWEIGRRIAEFEQGGQGRADYGEGIVKKLAADLTRRLGRGFGFSHVKTMRQFFLAYPRPNIGQSPIGQSRKSKLQSLIGESPADAAKRPAELAAVAKSFPLSWTHYTLLLRVSNPNARRFYEEEALRGGWSVRQLDRQIGAQFYERTALSRDKAVMLTKGSQAKPEDRVTPEEEIKNPYVLEFLGLKDEYSESELEDALIRHLESFLLELGADFTFVARQRRLRVGDQWFRIDLVFYHRRLRCLVLIDLKLDRFTHADAGQMHLYLNYAREHWTHADENPPVGLILCAEKDEAVAHYALEGLPNKVLAAEYKTTLPSARKLEEELKRTKLALDARKALGHSAGKEKK